jgi:hypothetical protein
MSRSSLYVFAYMHYIYIQVHARHLHTFKYTTSTYMCIHYIYCFVVVNIKVLAFLLLDNRGHQLNDCSCSLRVYLRFIQDIHYMQYIREIQRTQYNTHNTYKTYNTHNTQTHVKKGGVLNVTAKYTRKAHDKDINSIDIAPNDKITATASQDRSIKVLQSQIFYISLIMVMFLCMFNFTVC